jgi:NAD-dependent SIR2 family protein deacetylase
MRIKEFMKNYLDNIEKAKNIINEAEKVVIGLGAGMSASGGLNYTDKELFNKWYPEYAKMGFSTIWELVSKYWVTTIKDLSLEDAKLYWGFWARHTYHIRYEAEATKPYMLLKELLKNKEKYLITTNGDHQSQKAFGYENILTPQGDYGYFQTVSGRGDIIENKAMVLNMINNMESEFKIREEDIPFSSLYNERLEPNLRCDDRFVSDKWMKNYKEYESFIKKSEKQKILFIEIGVGFNTPSIIRWPFEKYTYQIKDANLIRVNLDDASVSKEVESKSLSFKCDINTLLEDLIS